MTLDAVYEIIQQVSAAELKSQQYARWLASQLDSLHRVISLQGMDPVSDLRKFVLEYVSLAPRIVECVADCAEQCQRKLLFQPFIDISVEYFVHPSVQVLQHTGLDGLLVRAYQSHRLIEELYENNMSLRDSPICELRATQANLLAHYLIGEPFANEIDQATHVTFRNLVSMPDYYHLDLAIYLAHTNDHKWQPLNMAWLALLDNHNIQMSFSLGYSC